MHSKIGKTEAHPVYVSVKTELAAVPEGTSDFHARWITTTDAAKLIRSALKLAFPATKFSVRQRSGGCAIRVGWPGSEDREVANPTHDEVNAVVRVFATSRFCGQSDSSGSVSLWLYPDGSVEIAKCSGYGETRAFDNKPSKLGGVEIQGGASHVFTR